MTLVERIKKDSIAARIAKDSLKSNLLVTLYAEVVKVGKDKGNRETTDEEAVAIVKKFINNIEESDKAANSILPKFDDVEALKNYVQKPGHAELVKKRIALQIEKELLELYLPKQFTKEELTSLIVGMNSKDVGYVMKQLKINFAGMYDGKLASEIVKGL